MANKPNKLIDAIKDNLKIVLLAIILLVVFNKHVVMIITMTLLMFIGHFMMKISRIMPHISLETVTPSAILIGYIWGWPAGLAFGIIVGLTGFIKASQLNLTILICSLLMGFVGVLAPLFKSLGMSFAVAYLVSYTIRGLTSFTLMRMIGQSPVENISHSFVESGYNMVVVIHFMMLFYKIITSLI
ncbi:hypothetical protein JXC34_04535 [Candidatus Woesearchaeota archaeon]|nr:hypothetical protein [Candidatus Woesearchaeota archaeon]